MKTRGRNDEIISNFWKESKDTENRSEMCARGSKMADADWWRPHQPTRRRGRNNRPIVLEAAAGGTGGYPIRAHLSASRDVSGSCAYLVVLSTGDLQRLGFFLLLIRRWCCRRSLCRLIGCANISILIEFSLSEMKFTLNVQRGVSLTLNISVVFNRIQSTWIPFDSSLNDLSNVF